MRSAAKEIQSQESNIDCLVCNAGVLLNEKQMTCEGNESTIASHLIGGSYLLTKLLLPQLKAVSSTSSSNNDVSRVIYVTSGGMLLTKFPSWDIATTQSPNAKYDGTMAYAYAKRGQVLLAEEMTKLCPEIKFVSVHPGKQVSLRSFYFRTCVVTFPGYKLVLFVSLMSSYLPL